MHLVLRYGLLALILSLLAIDIRWRLRLSPGFAGERYSNGVAALMLLFNHLAFQFRWPTPVLTAALRILAFGWLAFGLLYIFYQWRVC
ncbi:hypothetical protein [Pedosphaera parvula]|nr:hypothetical protein [Pedosphaera parvula]